MTAPYIVRIDNAGGADADLLGGKGASLARLTDAGLRVPPGFVVSTQAYRHAVLDGIRDQLDAAVAAVPAHASSDEMDAACARVRALVAAVELDEAVAESIHEAYLALGDDVAVAVRSSSAVEDSVEHSFAGEHDTYLWVRGVDEVIARVLDCWASMFTTRAMEYRRKAGLSGGGDAMAVVVQEMVEARAAGVFMTLDPENGDRSKIAVEAIWGLGEPLVSGTATPDSFKIDKVTGEVVHRSVVDKPIEMVRAEHGTGTATVEVAADRRETQSLTEDELAELLRLARIVEKHFGCPQDGEFAIKQGGGADSVYLVQSRPETVWSHRSVEKASTGATLMDSILSHLVPDRDAK
ncbi:PEP/pyruvate-binding domain-containing protein [Pseudonocardia adelaidensis]|uniref:PEP/pyruvate-binding domain-containing protein n=1 Tax=Pseudonocardia adelaidensis TaxID=648754 RepID=UPI0031EE148E